MLSLCLFNLYAEYMMQKPGWMKLRLESRLPGEISITLDMRWYHSLMAESEEELRSLLKVINESEKAGLKLNIQKMKIMASSPFSLLTHVQLFATPWTVVSQASLSITNFWSLLKLMSIELMMPSTNAIHPLSSPSAAFNISQHQGLFH